MERRELFRDVGTMAFETLRVNRLRSGLTITGIVIGITAIVGMTALVRGFDRSLQNMLQTLGPKTMFIVKFSGLSFMAGKDFKDLLRRPNLSVQDGQAIRAMDDIIRRVDIVIGGGFAPQLERMHYRGERSKPMFVIGASQYFAEVNHVELAQGRVFTDAELRHRRRVAVLGQGPYHALFQHVDPIGKKIRIGAEQYQVIGVLGPRPSPGGFNMGQDEFALVPYTRYQVQYGTGPRRIHGQEHVDISIVAVPHDHVGRDEAMRAVEDLIRIRHGLRIDEENDFDIVNQESAMRVFSQLTSATFLALIVLSSIALLVGGIGVMAIMTISVTERTREIGLRKALGARRREILWQFLLEAATLTTIGGVIGVILGSGLGFLVHWISAFPISLPWWSFAIGLGFSSTVGLVFGMLPAWKASQLDPIEALRYE